MKILVTGGAGFIGSAVVRHIISTTDHQVITVDKLTYAGNLTNLKSVTENPRHHFVQGDICDAAFITGLFERYQPDGVINLAAESHVDRSIDAAGDFVMTNVVGTVVLLEAATQYWHRLSSQKKQTFRYLQVSTDEVYGDIGNFQGVTKFSESSPYAPSSPYSASKAAADHFVRAWHRTHQLPVIVTNSSNNYGPYHFPEKLIPLMILNGLAGKPLPIYGRGDQVRDWLYVDDHAQALLLCLERGQPGKTYNIGGNNQLTNLSVVQQLCELLETLAPNKPATMITQGKTQYADLIRFVEDRPGHDHCYAIDTQFIQQTLGWAPQETFASGLEKTVRWFLHNEDWWRPIRESRYAGTRLGLSSANVINDANS